MIQVLRWTVPVNDGWHEFLISGDVLHVASRTPDAVEMWVTDTGGPRVRRRFQVFATGRDVPDNAVYVGTVLVAGGILVWHLFELGVAE